MSDPIKKMSFVDKVRASISNFIPKFGSQTSFESVRHSVTRTRIDAPPPDDFRRELTDSTRKEMVRLSRWLEKNNGLYRQMFRDTAIYTVGDGITLQSTGGDFDWQNIVEAEWEQECENPEVSGRFSMLESQFIICETIDRDGEIFIIKCKRNGIPKFQMVECHRVESPPTVMGQANVYDGIRYNKFGQPTQYYVKQSDGSFTTVPASSMIHIYDAEHSSASRAYPPHQHAISNLRDEMDLLSMEKVACKDNARTSRILKTSDATADLGDVGLGQAVGSNAPTDPNTLNRVLGGVTQIINPNEELIPYSSARPTSAFTGFIEHLRRDSVMGGLPFEFVADPTRAGGASVRLVTAKVGRYVSHRQNIIINRFLKPYFQYWLGTKINKGDLPSAKNWWKCEWVTPKSVSVDAGRDSANERADLEMGRILPSDDFQSRGMGFEKSIRKKARDLAFIDRVSKETGVDASRIWKQSQFPQPQQAQPMAKDELGNPIPPNPQEAKNVVDPLENNEPELEPPNVSDQGVAPADETTSVDIIPKQNQGLSRLDRPS